MAVLREPITIHNAYVYASIELELKNKKIENRYIERERERCTRVEQSS